ncbi:ABC transporter permease subunit [Catenovulum sp. 2E275]|uniref:ABC transporter permease subunit n=1 Tax=Catenovulum sp. 2E275 TaxID=2980497 RepID=UPI0021D0DDA6|nr:ABC transporter permease subunit [Catenovulum sp. 2E275]MCU4676809.1 ABC transporter permease subunit [Catenovulum sp. 2E275]
MVGTIFKREVASYFATASTYVFIFFFLVSSAFLTFYHGNLYELGQAELFPFFSYLPWIYLFLVPAITMKIWADERKTGTIELLMTLPVSIWQLTIGKFFAAWFVLGVSLFLTFPLWLTINYLGNPDQGTVFTAYGAALLMAGTFLSISMFIAAFSSNQGITFIFSCALCFLFVVIGNPIFTGLLTRITPQIVVDTLASFSFLNRFEALASGVLNVSDIIYFFISIIIWLIASLCAIDYKESA